MGRADAKRGTTTRRYRMSPAARWLYFGLLAGFALAVLGLVVIFL